jgi:two-component system NtrC family response regulator
VDIETALPSSDSPSLAAVLSEIAEIASETLDLRDVLGRIGCCARRVIPFDNMAVVRMLDGERAVLHASTAEHADPHPKCFDPMSLTAWSPRWRPRAGAMRKLDDARSELDPSFPMDAKALAGGLTSGLWEPFRRGKDFTGGVWLCSHAARPFEPEHQAMLKPIAALLGSAVEHWRIWNAERLRQERLEKVEALFETLAGSLDVREVFERLSDGMQPIVSHDAMVLTELDVHARTIRVAASASRGPVEIPTAPVPVSEEELSSRKEFEILRDIPDEVATDTKRKTDILASGMRSWLRVPVKLSGQVKGSLSLFHREPSRFGREEAAIARRLADHIALTMSLRRLSEEARRASDQRERAEQLEIKVENLIRQIESRERGRVVGPSKSWRETMVAVGRVAASETTVLITGESGTGKEVVSSLIHQGSPRAGRPFVAINCAALPEQLLESELFGHERGAFTGAVTGRLGRIEQAAGGTLFLDEIGELSPLVQAKLLRVLEQREFQRVGGTRTLRADVRLLAATNRDLTTAVARGAFREDLFYRLNVFQIHIAPLRERRQDILPLADLFLDDLSKSMDRPSQGIASDAREWMLSHAWPGNVRELRNVIERAILLCDGGWITREHLPAGAPREESSVPPPLEGQAMNLGEVERGLIAKALDEAKGNKSKAAKILGLSRAQLYWRLEKYDIR